MVSFEFQDVDFSELKPKNLTKCYEGLHMISVCIIALQVQQQYFLYVDKKWTANSTIALQTVRL